MMSMSDVDNGISSAYSIFFTGPDVKAISNGAAWIEDDDGKVVRKE